MATLLGGVALALIHIVENQPIRSRLAMYKPLIRFNSCLKQTYISHTSVIEVDAVDVCVHISRRSKEELVWATDKWLQTTV